MGQPSPQQTLQVDDRVLDGPHGSLPVRIYRPAEALGPGMVWVHGGGFVEGDIDMAEAHWVSTALAERGITVVSVDYRLAPLPADWVVPGRAVREEGVRFPVAHDEVVFAHAWALGAGLAPGPWALGGASAGGNLAAGAVLELLHEGGPVPAFVFLAYPTVHALQRPHSAELTAALADTPQERRFTPEVIRTMYENYLGPGVDVDTAPIRAIPGLASAEELAGHPRTLVINSERDDLRTSGEAYAEALSAAGVDVTLLTEPGTFHGHLNNPDEPAAERSIDVVARELLRSAAQQS